MPGRHEDLSKKSHVVVHAWNPRTQEMESGGPASLDEFQVTETPHGKRR